MAEDSQKSAVKILDHINIAELNRGQSSKVIKRIATEDKTALILKNGKPLAFVMSNSRYERLLKKGIKFDEC
jgi:PHD/YefM family antitoxin component YafN of YafNO toxin-antitoxin module